MAGEEATKSYEGRQIPYTPSGADVAAGDVIVLVSLVAIATTDIPDGRLGALDIDGVFKVPKATGTAMPTGTLVYWDGTNKRITTTSSGNTFMGKMAEDAASADALGLVRLTP